MPASSGVDKRRNGILLDNLELNLGASKRRDSNDSTKVNIGGLHKARRPGTMRRRPNSFSPEARKGKNSMRGAGDLAFDFKLTN